MSPRPPPPPPQRNVLDLGAVASANAELTVRPPETPEERAARLVEVAKDAEHRRRKDWWTFVAALLASMGIGGVSLWYAVRGAGDLQKWAMSTVTLIIGGAVGYWTGTKTASRS
jgi:hypothetical protein